jgi:hypothetical protein
MTDATLEDQATAIADVVPDCANDQIAAAVWAYQASRYFAVTGADVSTKCVHGNGFASSH